MKTSTVVEVLWYWAEVFPVTHQRGRRTGSLRRPVSSCLWTKNETKKTRFAVFLEGWILILLFK